MRSLLARDSPAMADAPWESLLSFGFVRVGAQLLYQRLTAGP